MEQNNYVFRVTAMGEEYLPQISYALEKRTELLSRIQYPGMWSATDKLRSSVREPRGKIKRKNPFDKSARLLLEQRKTTDDATVAFDETGMTIAAGGGEELVPYDKMEYIVEAEGILLLTFDEKVIAVKKDDMVCGDMESFHSFITDQSNFVPYN